MLTAAMRAVVLVLLFLFAPSLVFAGRNVTAEPVTARVTSQTNTTSATAVDMAATVITITTRGGPVLVTFTGYLLMANESDDTMAQYLGRINLVRDNGLELTHGFIMFDQMPPGFALANTQTLTYIDSPPAGTHTYGITYAVAAGARGNLYAGHRTLQAVELGH